MSIERGPIRARHADPKRRRLPRTLEDDIPQKRALHTVAEGSNRVEGGNGIRARQHSVGLKGVCGGLLIEKAHQTRKASFTESAATASKYANEDEHLLPLIRLDRQD